MAYGSRKNSLPVLWYIKSCFVFISIFFAVFYTLPSFLPENNLFKPWLPDSTIALGLDLKGGVSLTLNVDVEDSLAESIKRSVERFKQAAQDKYGKPLDVSLSSSDFTLSFKKPDDVTKDAAFELFNQHNSFFVFSEEKENELFFKPQQTKLKQLREQVMVQALNVIRNRIDQFGVAEPSLFQEGDDRIVVELPGITDLKRARDLIGKTSKLEFRLVKPETTQLPLMDLMREARTALNVQETDTSTGTIQAISNWLVANDKISKNSVLFIQRLPDRDHKYPDSKDVPIVPYVLEQTARLSGDLIEDAQAVQTTQNYIPEYAVSLTFKPAGARVFEELTKEASEEQNAPHQLAILLDGHVQSAPVVNGPIAGGKAQITLGRSVHAREQYDQARDLALVLRAGSLPAQVTVGEERQIGPSEGAQNIHAGIVSSLVAAGVVIMMIWMIYGVNGLIANIAMLLNVLLILAFLALFGATLTLPGIAGIVLTMAIAVDGNVIINERIREELRQGASRLQAFYKGYESSLTTIVDAHLTSAVAGLVLLVYGNPSVKGFALTLLAGIFCTLFTSYYVTQVIGEWLVIRKTQKTAASAKGAFL